MSDDHKKFALVRWVGEETLSIMSATSLRAGQKMYPGAFADLGKYFEGEVLAVSGEQI